MLTLFFRIRGHGVLCQYVQCYYATIVFTWAYIIVYIASQHASLLSESNDPVILYAIARTGATLIKLLLHWITNIHKRTQKYRSLLQYNMNMSSWGFDVQGDIRLFEASHQEPNMRFHQFVTRGVIYRTNSKIKRKNLTASTCRNPLNCKCQVTKQVPSQLKKALYED